MLLSFPGPCGRRGGAARTGTDAVAVLAWRCLDWAVDLSSDSPVVSRADSPDGSIVPFGRLRGVLLVQHRLRDGRRPLLLRELIPSIDLRHGRCMWTSGTIVCDLARPASHLGDPLSLKPWQQTLVQWAAVLKKAMEGSSSSVRPAPPVLPFTLAEFPAGTQILPRPTKAIQQIAMRAGIPWEAAWEQLSVDRGGGGPSVFDTRLCDRLKPGFTWPGAVALYHDFRNLPMRHVWRAPLQASVPESLFLYQPHALLDGWNAPSPLMQRLGMEVFSMPCLQAPAPAPLAIAG